jgi:kumamolisin
MSRAQRLAAVRAAIPSQDRHEQVADYLRAQGLSVTDESSWSVTASGSAAQVADLFGTRPSLPTRPTTSQRRASTGALPRLPAALDGVASAAFPTTGGPKAFKPLSTSGSDYRNAYASAAQTRAGMVPFNGAYRSQRLTIATVQLAGWNSADLATYAREDKIPYSSSSLTQVPVDQSSVPGAQQNPDDGAVEVDLDQESLLSTDPSARQRAYFAPNTDAGFADAFSQVLDDVTGASGAYHGGDSHIAALSVSWGECEALSDSAVTDEISDVLEPIMRSLVAAGVTIFASSGDTGAYDCDSQTGVSPVASVDYPASSPEVVGVGGTTLTASSRTPNTGSNWHESAWSCSTFYQCTSAFGTGGSGGGTSSVFSEPTYQSAHLSAALNSPGKRLVPDIAAEANPATGFELYTSDPHDGSGWFTVGGTSLASPVSAALLTDTLTAHGSTRGVGDIHPALYAASATAGSFRDITAGSNGAHQAGTGYDEVTGLGAPLWPVLADRIFAGARPLATTSVSRRHPRKKSQWRQVTVTWGGTAPTGNTLVSAEVTVRNGSGAIVWHRSSAAPRGTLTFTGAKHTTYRSYVTVDDSSHVMSTVRVTATTVPSKFKRARHKH